jgi:N-formylglutamate deformylase
VTQPENSPVIAPQWVLEPAAAPVPVVACLPHGGRDFPAELAGDLVIRPDALQADWLTRELYAFLPELGITTVATTLSRFVADVNRDPASGHGGFWTTVVSAHQPNNGRPLYTRELTPAEISGRVALAHEPFHRELDSVITGLLQVFPRVLLLDLHSFGRPHPGDVVLGDRRGRTARPEAMALLSGALARHGFDVRLNERLIGGWTVERFAAHDRVDAIQVELSQRLYLDLRAPRARPGPPPAGDFAATGARLREVLAAGVLAPLLARYPPL